LSVTAPVPPVSSSATAPLTETLALIFAAVIADALFVEIALFVKFT